MNLATVLALVSLLLLAAVLFGLQRLARTLRALQAANTRLSHELEAQRSLAHAAAQEHGAALAAMQAASSLQLAALPAALEQQIHTTLTPALAALLADFNARFQDQCTSALNTLQDTVASNATLQDKHRALQLDMAHHARRNADQMDQATSAFRTLLASGAQVAEVGTRLGDALALLGPRQLAIEATLGQLAQALSAASARLDALQAHGDEALAELGERTRRHIDTQSRQGAADAAAKQQLQLAAVHKELNESLNKAFAALSKQLATLAARLSTDLGPMAQQIRRVADQAKVK